ncbi:MAG: LD-carboxypeptidase [Deltaproteobacteria bacterium]|jgi:muramoyltetrapeptide carboxypeptidase|nr:LD-carboxypeptidase [Deltaproteobacteria bacterium]
MTKKNGDGALARPLFLPREARLGLFAPAGPTQSVQRQEGATIVRDWGFSLELPPEEEPARGYLASPDRDRLERLLDLMGENKTDALWATRGGYGSMRLLPALQGLWKDFPPKPIIGFSDITALHLARYNATGIGGWHASNLNTLGRLGWARGRKDWDPLLGKAVSPWLFEPDAVLRQGRAEGPLLGGNLTLFACLYGTRYCPDVKGAILLLEDLDEAPYRLDRLLTGLSLRGAFDGLAAVVFGEFFNCGDKSLVREILSEFADARDYPVAREAPFGHGFVNSPWFYGEKGVLEAEDSGGRLCFPWRNEPEGEFQRA